MSAASESAPLAALARFAASLRQHPWFASVGQPGSEAEEATARRYLAGLDMAHCSVGWIADWRAAERVTRAPDASTAWWQAEEDARQALLAEVRRATAEADYLAAMNRVVFEATEAVMGPAAVAAARDGIADQALIRVAAGAAAQACHQAALATAAGAADDHPFALKFGLYTGGRWPLGVIGSRFFLF